MKALKNYTIAELIESLHHKGVEWVGKTTRKAPLIALLEELETQQELNESLVGHLVKSLGHLNHPASVLVALCRWWGSKVTSDDLKDLDSLQARVIQLSSEWDNAGAELLPSLDKVTRYSMNQLHQLPIGALWDCYEALGLTVPIGTLNDAVTRCDLLHELKHAITTANKSDNRNLPLDFENGNYAYETITMLPKSLPSNIWTATEGDRIHHNGTFHRHIVKMLRARGFYEPSVHYGGVMHSLYLCCDLMDKPDDKLPLDLEGCSHGNYIYTNGQSKVLKHGLDTGISSFVNSVVRKRGYFHHPHYPLTHFVEAMYLCCNIPVYK